MLPTVAVGWRASALRGEEAGRFYKVAGVSIVAAGGRGWGGAYARIKIPLQDCALKMQWGLMREGGVFAGHYGTCTQEIHEQKYIYVCTVYVL